MSSKNILINFLSSRSGGALCYMRCLLPYFNAYAESSNAHVILLLREDHKEIVDSSSTKFEVVQLPKKYNSTFLRIMWERMNLSKLAADKSIDVIFTPYQIITPVDNVANISMLRNMEPYVFHKYKYSIKQKIRNLLLKNLCEKSIRMSNKVIGVSSYVCDFMKNSLNVEPNKIVHVYHGRDREFQSNRFKTDIECLKSLGVSKQFIFTSGSLLPYRKLEVILNAYSKLDDALKDKFILVVAGDSAEKGYKQYIRDEINNLGIASRVVSLGHTSIKNMHILYRNCYVYITATEAEACPNIAIEALSSGCYVLSSDANPMPEIFGDAANYFPAGSVAILNKLMDQVLNDHLVHPNSKALNQSEKYNWDECASLTMAVIEEELKCQENIN